MVKISELIRISSGKTWEFACNTMCYLVISPQRSTYFYMAKLRCPTGVRRSYVRKWKGMPKWLWGGGGDVFWFCAWGLCFAWRTTFLPSRVANNASLLICTGKLILKYVPLSLNVLPCAALFSHHAAWQFFFPQDLGANPVHRIAHSPPAHPPSLFSVAAAPEFCLLGLGSCVLSSG